VARGRLLDRIVELRYHVRGGGVGPSDIRVNGVPLPLATRDRNPYRIGGWRVPAGDLSALLGPAENTVEITL
jgi:hypothetical protein